MNNNANNSSTQDKMQDAEPLTDGPEMKQDLSEGPIQSESQSGGFSSALSADQLQKIMSSEGPIVKAILLKCNGEIEEIDYNTTPRLNQARDFLEANPTIIGQYDELNVIIARGKHDNNKEQVPLNPHKLRWPFHKDSFHGNILLFRTGETAIPEDFTRKEYDDFMSRKSEDENKPEPQKWSPQAFTMDDIMRDDDFDDGDDNNNEFEAIDENDNDNDNDDDDNDDDFDDDGTEQMVDLEGLKEMLKQSFKENYGRDPNEQEMELMVSEMIEKFGMAGDDDDDDYFPPDEADSDGDDDNDNDNDGGDDNDDDNDEMQDIE